jgi:hypothetical protein
MSRPPAPAPSRPVPAGRWDARVARLLRQCTSEIEGLAEDIARDLAPLEEAAFSLDPYLLSPPDHNPARAAAVLR